MKRLFFLFLVAGALIPAFSIWEGGVGKASAELVVVSDQTVGGFAHPESVACDPDGKVLYASQFGSALRPTLKDGKGVISKLSLKGVVIEERFLPMPGDTPLNKPKGIWVEQGRLWVTDIDVVWEFDLRSRKGRKVGLPGAKFANDPAVVGNALYVSDTGAGIIYRVTPADFLKTEKVPSVEVFSSGLSFGPNGIFPARSTLLIVVGYDMGGKDRGIYSVNRKGNVRMLSRNIGKLDGVAQLTDQSLLVTDWKSRSLFQWTRQKGIHKLAGGFEGPADFCVVPNGKGVTVIVPDLVKSEIRFIQMAR